MTKIDKNQIMVNLLCRDFDTLYDHEIATAKEIEFYEEFGDSWNEISYRLRCWLIDNMLQDAVSDDNVNEVVIFSNLLCLDLVSLYDSGFVINGEIESYEKFGEAWDLLPTSLQNYLIDNLLQHAILDDE